MTGNIDENIDDLHIHKKYHLKNKKNKLKRRQNMQRILLGS